jgi:hypothetical protein
VTGDAHPGDGPNAQKLWVNAAIVIAPNANNEVGQPHTFTATLLFDTGAGLQPAGAGQPVTITLTGANGANPVPAGPFNLNTNANGQVQVTFTSATPGMVSGHASWTGSVAGSAPFTLETNGQAPNSGDAVKTFVDANIQISPLQATNPVGTNHTLTAHANVNDGTGPVNAPDGTVITFLLTNSNGATATFVGPTACTTSGGTGSCSVVISSPTAGNTASNAATNVVVGGVSLTPATGDAHVGDGPDAQKSWADDTVTTHVRDAANNDLTGGTVQAGTVVHDEATVAKAGGTPVSVPDPTGTVDFTLYNNGTCNGTVVATDPGRPLDASGVATSANFTTPASGTFSYKAHYNGDANYPAHDAAACESFTVQPSTRGGLIAPTETSCAAFAAGTAETLGQVNYRVKSGKIGQGINPGVFFYYTEITTTVPNQVVTVSQSNTSTNNAALFGILNGQAILYSATCAKVMSGTVINGGSGASFTVSVPGTYIIGIKYQTKTIAGTPAPAPADITYNFTTSLGGNTAASVLLKKSS